MCAKKLSYFILFLRCFLYQKSVSLLLQKRKGLKMRKLSLADLNILDVGNKIQIAGLIMSDGHTDYICYLPENNILEDRCLLDMDLSDWEKFIEQTDILETEIYLLESILTEYETEFQKETDEFLKKVLD